MPRPLVCWIFPNAVKLMQSRVKTEKVLGMIESPLGEAGGSPPW